MIKFKLCPRYRGDLCLAEDIFGRYLSCLQCGYLKDVPDDVVEKLALGPVREDEMEREAA